MRFLTATLVLLFVSSVSAAEQDSSVGRGPMARFQPFVGSWDVRHTLWSQTGEPPEVFEGSADIYFVSGGSILVVDETTRDRKYRFVGYHAFDDTTKKYVNWTASSKMVLAWGEGTWEKSRVIFHTRRLDARTGQPDPLVGKGVWEIVTPNKHVFRALRRKPDGAEIPFKEELYKRKPR